MGDNDGAHSIPFQGFVGQIFRLKEFNETKEDFLCYVERMEYFFKANAMPEERRVYVCMYVCMYVCTYVRTYVCVCMIYIYDLHNIHTYI